MNDENGNNSATNVREKVENNEANKEVNINNENDEIDLNDTEDTGNEFAD